MESRNFCNESSSRATVPLYLARRDPATGNWSLAAVESVLASQISLFCRFGSRIIRVDMDGNVTGVLGEFGKISGKLDIPHVVAVDSTGAIYSADFRNWRIDTFVKQ